MRESTEFFLKALCSSKPDDLYLLLWTLPEKESRWILDCADAVGIANELRTHDLYVGVGFSKVDYGPKQRCKSEDIAGIAGLWADIDLRSDAHPKTTLPASIEDALSILPAEFPPSMIVATGNGIHVWWFFKEPWVFGSDQEYDNACQLIKRFHTLIGDNASHRGWTYDRLSDLARVLRIPGTTNCKDPANPKPVTVYAQTDRRYNPSEFSDYLNEIGISDDAGEGFDAFAWTERFKDKAITINLNARIPDNQLHQWLDSDLKFKNTWYRQRHDLHDQSQSGYDLALARFGFRARLGEQEIVDLIVHHRAIHKQKARTRIDYFQRTLATAASAADRHYDSDRGLPARHPAHSDPSSAWNSAADVPTQEKALICQKLSQVFGIEILQIIKVSGKEPFYRVDTAAGSMHFENVAKLISQPAVRNAIAATIGKLIRSFKPSLWQELAQSMLHACIEQEGSEELHEDAAARMYIRCYLGDTSFTQCIGEDGPQIRRPVIYHDRIAISALDLQIYINKTTQQNLSVKAVAAMLASIGATTVRIRGKRIREQSRWELPVKEFDPAEYMNPTEETV